MGGVTAATDWVRARFDPVRRTLFPDTRPPPVDRPSVWPLLLIVSGWSAGTASILWFRGAPASLVASFAWASLAVLAASLLTCAIVRRWAPFFHLAGHPGRLTTLVVGVVIVTGIGSWATGGWGALDSPWVALASITAVPVALAAVGVSVRHQDAAFDVVGALGPIALPVTLAWIVSSAFFPQTGTALGVQVLCLVAAALLTLTLVALDWSRTTLLASMVLLGAALVLLAVQIGYRQRVDELISRPAADLRTEFDRLRAADETAVERANGAGRDELIATARARLDEYDATIRRVTDGPYRQLLATVDGQLGGALDAYAAGRVAEASEQVAAAEGTLDVLLAEPVPPSAAAQAGQARAAAVSAGDAVSAVVRFRPAQVTPTAPVDAAWRELCALERADRIVEVEACQAALVDEEVAPGDEEEVPAGAEEVPDGEEVAPGDVEEGPDGAEEVPAGAEEGPDGAEEVPAGAEGDLVSALDRLELAVAEYRVEVDPTDENAARLEAQRDRRSVVDIDLRDAVVAAPEAVFDAFTPERRTRLVPGMYGWIVVVLAALTIGRRLFKLNARQGPGPVSFASPTPDDPSYLTAFQVSLLSNVASPRSDVVTQVSDTLQGLSTVDGRTKGIVDTINGAVSFVFAGSRGYEASCVAVAPAEHDDPDGGGGTRNAATSTASGESSKAKQEWIVLARIVDAQTKAVVASRRVVGTDRHELARRAGQWAAGRILAESTRIPAWARWTELNSSALEILNREHGLEHTTRALAAAPTSGIVLVNHAYALLGAGRTIDAVLVAARAATIHPRHLQARNLLALCLVSLADDPEWQRAAPGQRAMVDEALRHLAGVLGVTYHARGHEGAGASAPDLDPAGRETNLAHALWTSVIEDVTWFRHLAATIRRPDRDSTWIVWRLGGPHRPTLARAIARAAKLADVDPDDAPTWMGEASRAARRRRRRIVRAQRRTVTWAERHHATHYVPYNLACAFARRGAIVEALTWLQRTLLYDTATSTMVSRRGLETDPDLDSLRHHPQFRAFLDHLDPGGEP